ncbi:10165_t:CDS:2, partial [Entrophospora sp. SA101]
MTLEYPGITITLNISSNNDNERNALKETLAPRKRIIETLLNESENVLNSPFNTKQEKDLGNNHRSCSFIKNKKNTTNDLIRSHTVVKREIRDVPSVGQGELEVKLLGSPNIRHAESYNCAAMLGKQYLLIGNDEGLSFMDFSVRYEVMKPIQIMRGIPFKKLQMLNDYGIMIAIAGKSQKIRIYRSSSLLHLIKFVLNSKPQVSVDFSKAPTFLKKFTDSGVKCEQCSKNADEGGGSLQQLSNSLEKADISSEEKLKVFQWASDYTKLTEISKDCMTFDVKETKSYLYLAVLSSNHVIYLFEYSLENNKDNNPLDIKFVHTQNYYIPETPCFINVLTGMYLIKHIIVGTNCSKAIMIDAHTSEVTEIYMKKNLIPRHEENPKWLSFIPIPNTFDLEFLIKTPIKKIEPKVIPLSSSQPLKLSSDIDGINDINTTITANTITTDDNTDNVLNKLVSPPTSPKEKTNFILRRSTNNRTKRYSLQKDPCESGVNSNNDKRLNPTRTNTEPITIYDTQPTTYVQPLNFTTIVNEQQLPPNNINAQNMNTTINEQPPPTNEIIKDLTINVNINEQQLPQSNNSIINEQPLPLNNAIINAQPLNSTTNINEQPPPSNVIVNEQPPPSNVIVNEQPPPSNVIVNEQPPPSNSNIITTINEQPPSNNATINEQPPIIDAISNEQPPIINAIINEQPPTNDVLSSQPPPNNVMISSDTTTINTHQINTSNQITVESNCSDSNSIEPNNQSETQSYNPSPSQN